MLLMIFPNLIYGQGKVIINEVMASCHQGHFDEHGEADDWLEVRSLSNEYVDIAGMFFLVDHEIWEIPQGRPDLTRIPPKGYAVLWFDGQDHQGAMHAPFALPRSGSTILLIDINGSSLLDAFTYSKQRTDISYGRAALDISASLFFDQATPGSENDTKGYKNILEEPIVSTAAGYTSDPIVLELSCEDGDIYYTLDASSPQSENAKLYSHPIPVDKNTVVRAICKSTTSIESEEFAGTYIFDEDPQENTIALIVDHKSLWSDGTGIYVEGNNDNYSQTGKEWQRQATIGFHGPEFSTCSYTVDLSISGNGSRSLAKKSFSIHGHKRNGSDKIELPFTNLGENATFSNFKLRADAAGGGHLKERFIYSLNERSGGRTEMQESLPFNLYLNGEYWGLYEIMPSKGEAFLEARTGDGSFDILTGASGSVRKGDRDAYEDLLELANDPRLSTGELHAELASMVDLNNFIDYWIFEIFSGKIDNSTNLRYYRPERANGKWRWITYDMDLWGDPRENTLARVLDHNDHHEYALVGLLMQDPLVRTRFINRFADLLNTSFRSENSIKILNDLEHSIHAQNNRDRIRWQNEMAIQSDILRQMQIHLKARPKVLLEHIEQQFGTQPTKVNVEIKGDGVVKINSLEIDRSKNFTYFSGVAIRLEAIPKDGYRSAGWSGDLRSDQTVIYVDPAKTGRIKAKFVKEGSGGHLLEDGLEERTSISIP